MQPHLLSQQQEELLDHQAQSSQHTAQCEGLEDVSQGHVSQTDYDNLPLGQGQGPVDYSLPPDKRWPHGHLRQFPDKKEVRMQAEHVLAFCHLRQLG